jgi:PAS domain S-box-containing protein
MMGKVLRVLNVEDSERDASLLRRHLLQAGYELAYHRVETPEAMNAALETQAWDVILCDYSMPQFSASAALALLKETGLDIPFIIISGTIGEELAVSAMLAGANDYLMKGNLARLGPAIDRELEEIESHRARRQAEEALKASEAELRTLFAAMTDIILVFDRQGRYLTVAPTDDAFRHIPPDDLIGKELYDVFSKEEADLLLGHIQRALDEGRMHRVEYSLRINGAQVWFDGSVSPMSKDEVLWVARDVTVRKRAEQLIQLQAIALGAAANAIAITDAEGIITWVNPAFTAVTGYAPEEVVGRSPRILKSGEHDAEFYEDLWKTVLSGQVWRGEMTNRRKDGDLYYQDQTITPVMNEAGDVTHFVAIQQDITQRKQAEVELRQAEEKYRSMFENAVEGIYQSTPEGVFTSVNPAMVRILGYESQEELTIHRMASQHYVDPNCWEKLQATLAGKGVVAGFECEVYRKDLSKVWISENIRAIRDGSRSVRFHEGSVEDITERKSLEEQFRQAQKMEAVGTLAGGIAHDFNNLLTAIIGYSDLNLQQLKPGNPLRDDIEEIRKAGERASSLTRQLLAFSRKQILEPRVLDLNHTVSDMQKMLQRLIGEDLRLETVLDPALGSVKADPGQIEQVLMNLAVNARDAMPDGGKVTIETANVDLDEHHASTHVTVKPGPYVRLTISDTGCGMDRQTQAHMFEPFFTTKAVGQGTGLGLSTVYGIVKQSGGSIWVYSEVGKGTTFKIYLPRVDEEVRELERLPPPAEFPRGTETILLAEDDETVRTITIVVLKTLGYEVLQAVNGDAALLICERFEGEIHLLLSDLVMPEMSGRELVQRLAGMLPHMRVLYMSGYTENAMVQQEVSEGSVSFLPKPFTPSSLAQKVREVLDKPVLGRRVEASLPDQSICPPEAVTY